MNVLVIGPESIATRHIDAVRPLDADASIYELRSGRNGIWDNQREEFVRNYNHRCPMKRMGNPDDIAPLCLFLVSDGAKYITGQIIAADGGWTAI